MFGKDKRTEKIGEAVAILIKDVEDIKKRVAELEAKNTPRGSGEFVSVISGFGSEEDFDKFKHICTEIASKDGSFKFSINTLNKETYLQSSNRDELHKKSMWLIKKTGIENLKYTIGEKLT